MDTLRMEMTTYALGDICCRYQVRELALFGYIANQATRTMIAMSLLIALPLPNASAQQPLPFPVDAKLSVTLTLCSLPSARHSEKLPSSTSASGDSGRWQNNTVVYAFITVKNVGKNVVTVDSLNWYGAVSYFVMNDCGNPVAPLSLGKADPVNDRTVLKPGRILSYESKNLDFVSSCAWFQYDLVAGQTYRVVAIYRPARYGGPIFCSQEVTVKVR